MSVTPPGGPGTPPPESTRPDHTRPDQQQRAAGNGTPGTGGNRTGTGQQEARHKGAETARAAGRFDSALSRARGGDAGAMGLAPGARHGSERDGDTGQREPRDGQLPAGTQILHVIAPQGQGTPAAPAQSAQVADVQHLAERIGTEVRLAEAQALRGPAGTTLSLALDLPRNALGLTGIQLAFGPKELTVTLQLPAGAEAHGFAEAASQLAQSLAQRFPNRTIRIARDDGLPAEDEAQPLSAMDLLRGPR